jgi:hypothetical protein
VFMAWPCLSDTVTAMTFLNCIGDLSHFPPPHPPGHPEQAPCNHSGSPIVGTSTRDVHIGLSGRI